eukprot:4141183-Prymnesium_polylepis.2
MARVDDAENEWVVWRRRPNRLRLKDGAQPEVEATRLTQVDIEQLNLVNAQPLRPVERPRGLRWVSTVYHRLAHTRVLIVFLLINACKLVGEEVSSALATLRVDRFEQPKFAPCVPKCARRIVGRLERHPRARLGNPPMVRLRPRPPLVRPAARNIYC